MTIRSASAETHHNRMVQSLAQYLARERWTNIRADVVGWANGSPVAVGHYEPDLSATDPAGFGWIFEVETCDTIGIAHTRGQWTAFSTTPARFGVMTPESCVGTAKLYATQWRLHVDQWWWEEGT